MDKTTPHYKPRCLHEEGIDDRWKVTLMFLQKLTVFRPICESHLLKLIQLISIQLFLLGFFFFGCFLHRFLLLGLFHWFFFLWRRSARINNDNTVKADAALDIDCADIMGEGKESSAYFDRKNSPFGKSEYSMGYVIIESDTSLDVDRVNTAGNVETDQITEWPEPRPSKKKREPSAHHGGTAQAGHQQQHGGHGKKAPPKKIPVKKAPPKQIKVVKPTKKVPAKKVQPKVQKKHHTKMGPSPRTRTVSQQVVASIDSARVPERAFKK